MFLFTLNISEVYLGMNYLKQKKISGKKKASLAVLLLLLVGALFLTGAALKLEEQVKQLSPTQKKALVIGHAGSAFFSPLNPFNPLPPNSQASIAKAFRDGADGIEIDVHVTQDGVPVLYHDITLNTMSAAKGIIAELPADKVLGVAFKGGMPYDLFHSEKIISFESVLQQLVRFPDFPYLHLDLRNPDPRRNLFYAQSVMRLLNKYNYPLAKISFVFPKPNLLVAFREIEPKATLLLDTGGDFEAALQTVLTNKLQGLVTNGRDIDAAKVKKARQHQLQVVFFGGKARSSIYKMLLLEPDAIEVNNVAAMHHMVQ